MNWLIILDKDDIKDVVDMIEHTGSTYLPLCNEMNVNDVIYIATTEYEGRVLYKVNLDILKGWTSEENGEVLCDTHAFQPMLISDKLLLKNDDFRNINKEQLYNPQIIDEYVATYLSGIFADEDKYSAANSVDMKIKIIHDSFTD